MDLIDRQALLKTLNENKIEFDSDINYFIMHAPSVNQWIPCSERLPGYNIRVLVIDRNNSIDIAELIDYSDINEPDEWWSYEYKVHDPVAWMPLPEPWKGEDNA